METTLAAVHNGMSIRMAAEKYRINRSTLGNKFNRKYPKRVGRPTTSTEEETEICDILLRYMKVGVPLSKRGLIRVVKVISLAKGENILLCFCYVKLATRSLTFRMLLCDIKLLRNAKS